MLPIQIFLEIIWNLLLHSRPLSEEQIINSSRISVVVDYFVKAKTDKLLAVSVPYILFFIDFILFSYYFSFYFFIKIAKLVVQEHFNILLQPLLRLIRKLLQRVVKNALSESLTNPSQEEIMKMLEDSSSPTN